MLSHNYKTHQTICGHLVTAHILFHVNATLVIDRVTIFVSHRGALLFKFTEKPEAHPVFASEFKNELFSHAANEIEELKYEAC